MNTYILYPTDSLDDTWLFFEDDASGKLVPRKEYRDLACRTCGKMDEDVAISRGISEKMMVRTKKDWIATCDDWILVSDKLRDHITSLGFLGVSFIPLVQPGHSLLICDCRVQTDETLAGFDNENKCMRCGRYQERLIGPLLDGMAVPDTEDSFFVSSIANENVKVAYRPVFASGKIMKSLKAVKIKGIDFVEAM